jgi:hypothetical protein
MNSSCCNHRPTIDRHANHDHAEIRLQRPFQRLQTRPERDTHLGITIRRASGASMQSGAEEGPAGCAGSTVDWLVTVMRGWASC